MKRVLFFCGILWCLAIPVMAQFSQVQIGVDGLTCSQCSRSVEMRLRKLSFVREVQMDLEHTQGTLTLRPGARIAFDQIAGAIREAGFSVRFIEAEYKVTAETRQQESCFVDKGQCYQLLYGHLPEHASRLKMRFVGKGMIDAKRYKQYQARQAKVSCACGPVAPYLFVIP